MQDAYAAVRDEGAAFALPLSALRVAEGALTVPVVQKQVALNAEHHRAFLDGGSRAAAPGRRTDGLPLDEANVRARDILQKRPDIKVRELADAIPCSIGQVSRLPAWRAVLERRAKDAPPRSVRATAIDPELLELMAQQRTEMAADERLPARRVARQRKRLAN